MLLKRSFKDAFIKISRTEGIRSLWSGLSPTMQDFENIKIDTWTRYPGKMLSQKPRAPGTFYGTKNPFFKFECNPIDGVLFYGV